MFSSLFSLILSVYFVSFTDKSGSQPIDFAPRAVEQRTKWQIATDSLDYAVVPAYLDSLRHAGATIYHCSRWMNGATVEMSDETAARVQAFPFVQAVEMTRESQTQASAISRKKRQEIVLTDSIAYGQSREQLARYNLLPLHAAGYEGQGILLAVCDGGFTNAQKLSCFDASHRFGIFDFTDDADDFYGATGSHGTMCLSTIAAIDKDYYGSATRADYYLMRSEESETESPKEMDNLVAALEKADSLGVNIFSASLGYTEFDNSAWNLTYQEMDGKSTRCSRAAAIAAEKGMLVCVAAGNSGNAAWHYIDAPADADGILCVGAVNVRGEIASFSSRGPASDGRTKPDICAVGAHTYLINPKDGNINDSNGTSFACPLIAGLAASLWSALPDENAQQIRERIIRSADHYLQPNDDYGYGIPDAWAAYQGTTDLPANSITNTLHKVLLNGSLCIQQGEHLYDVLGRPIR